MNWDCHVIGGKQVEQQAQGRKTWLWNTLPNDKLTLWSRSRSLDNIPQSTSTTTRGWDRLRWHARGVKNMNQGNSLALVCFEFTLVDIPVHSWWIDSVASIHITNSLQELINKRKAR